MGNFQINAPQGRRHRVSSDSVWPLRRADGRTWAQAKEDGKCLKKQ